MNKLKTTLPPILLFFLILGLAHLRILSILRQEREASRAEIEALCLREATELEGLLSRLLKAPSMMGALIRLGSPDRPSFEALANAIREVFPGVESIGLAPGGVVTAVYPALHHQKALGTDLMGDPLRNFGSTEAVRTRTSIITGPFHLFIGEYGFLARVPVFTGKGDKEGFWGFVTAVMSVDRLVRLSGLEGLAGQGYAYRLEKVLGMEAKKDLLAGEPGERDGFVSRDLDVSGVKLSLSLGRTVPGPGLASFWAGYAVSAALALAASGLLCCLLRRPARYRALADSRIAKLREVNRRLAKAVRESRRASKRLEASAELSRGMFEDSPAVKIMVDPRTLAIVDANPSAARFFGWPRERLAGMPAGEILLLDQEEAERDAARAMRGESGPRQARCRLASGEVRDVEIFSGPVRHHGAPLLQSVLQDVTDRENARRELKKNEERLESVFNGVDLAIIVSDSQGRIQLVNRGFSRMFGIPGEKAVGKSFLDITSPEDQSVSRTVYEKLRGGEMDRASLQKRYLRANGESFWGNLRVSAVRDSEGRLASQVAVVADLTGLLEAKQAAEDAGLAKSRFLSNVSHEIRSPLNAIMGLTELTLRTSLTPKQRGNLEKALASSKALLAVIESILDFAQLDSDRLALARVPFSPADLMASIESRFAPEAAAKGLFLRVEAGADLPAVLEGDPVRLEQALSCLVSNAVKFTRRGEVAVRARLEGREEDGARLEFTVSDTGIGMDQDQVESLFSPFVQADAGLTRAYGGTGLGLSIARGLARLMGTDIAVRSAKGQGSVFSLGVTFPVLEGGGDAPADSVVEGGLEDLMRGLRGKRVLIVDDDSLGRHTAREMLELAGIEPAEAENGPRAVEIIGREAFDAVLLDIRMPDMNGFEALKAIRRLPGGSNLPVVALTGDASGEDRLRCLQAGMDDHLGKPLDAASLFAALRPLLLTPRRDAARELPALDRERALALLMGNRDLYRRLLEGFVREYAQSGSRIRELAGEQSEDAVALAHSVKGLAANLGGERLRVAAFRLESILRGGEAAPLPEALDAFEAALREFTRLADQAAGELAGEVGKLH